MYAPHGLTAAGTWLLVAFVLFLLLQMTRFIAARMFGVLVHAERGRVDFPQVPSNFNLEQWLRLQPAWSIASLGTVPIAEIESITRERGIWLHLHGPFGSRCIAMGSKQRRDECIAAIERMAGRRLVGRDLGY